MRRSLLLLTLAVLMAGCTSSNPYSRGRSQDPNEPFGAESRQFFLYKVEIDETAVAQGAQKLFDEPPPGWEFGLNRRAQGFFSYTDKGFCSVEVACAEPVIGVSGRQSEHVYRLLKFYGRMSESGSHATISSGEAPSVTPTGRVSEISLEWDEPERIAIQAIVKNKAQAYIFHFHRHRIPDRAVPFPH